jgi:putative transposase
MKYKTIRVPLKCNKKDFEYVKNLNKVSAQIWNNCVKMDKEYTKKNKKSMTLSMLEFENKQKFPIHAKGINHIVIKYYNCRNAMWKSIKKKQKNSKLAKLPYKQKEYMPTGWDSQAIYADYVNCKINLIRKRGFK